jgi:hypothetical protein
MAAVFPSSRAFVVHIPLEADPGLREFSGRVEHVKSGKSARFGALEELRKFMARTLREEEAGSASSGSSRTEGSR